MSRLAWHEIEHVERDDFTGQVATIPSARMKAKVDHALPLTPQLLEIIGKRPADAKRRPFVFEYPRGERPYADFARGKRTLDREIARRRRAEGRDPMPPWQLSRDIRRTAKTLMQRAGVRPDISERCLAHTIGGVEGVYDRWGYLPEKYDALCRLAALLDRITNPPAANVHPFPTEKITAAG
jgi:integrase